MTKATRSLRFVERLTVPLEPGARSRARLFVKNRQMLMEGFGRCWACGGSEELEAHHIVPWSMRALVSPEGLGRALDAFDPYDRQTRDPTGPVSKPVHDINDLRNLILLCRDCHQGPGLGSHALTMPTWLAAVACRAGAAITVEQAVKRGVI